MLYDWKDDIYDLADDETAPHRLGWDREAVDEAFYKAGETIAAVNGSDPFDEAAYIIGLYYVSDRSKLARYLDVWHELHGKDTEDAVRDYTPFRGGFLFVTGCNYSIWSNDLLGNYHGDGTTTRVFESFVNAMEETLDEW